MKNDNCPLVSVVMLNFNGLNYLKKTIPSILEIDYPNYEFIIVDNGSTDGSIDFIKEFEKITLIENRKNLGYSKGKNLGIREAKGEYIFCLDDDILLTNSKIITNLLKFYRTLINPCFINVLLVDHVDLSMKPIVSKQYGSYYGLFGIRENAGVDINKIIKIDEPIETVISFGGNMFFKKNNWVNLGGLDESQKFNLDDDDISTRARVLGYKNYLFNQNYILHLGIERRKNNKQFRDKFKYYFCGKGKPIVKNFQLYTILWMFPLFTFKTTLKTFKQALFRLDLLIFVSFFESICIFIRDFNYTLNQRKIIQSKRKVNDNAFLKIKRPKFD